MRLSAIVPTHNRPEALRRCLQTLQAQRVDRSALEVLVVDDGTGAQASRIVETVAGQGPIETRYEHHRQTGLNDARNHGASMARGEVLAFLDDDTLVSPGWAAVLLRAFEAHPCAGVGGRVVLDLAGPEPDWLGPRRCYLAEYDLGIEPRWLDSDPVPVGANCAVRRTELERLNGFRRGLDRTAGSLVSNGDTEFFRRLRASRGRLRYEPDARVIHCVPAERLTLEYFAKRLFAQGISDELLLTLEDKPIRWRRRVDLARLIGWGARVLCKDVLRGRGTANGRLEVCYWAGRFAAVGMDPPS